ncbi:MAG: circadian clock KaiB family protein, partial [Pseudomonadota bacterium]
CKHHVDRLRALFDENGESQDGLTVVDLDEEPERALSDDILAIPTILRRAPPPERRVIGDMTESERVWRLLRR